MPEGSGEWQGLLYGQQSSLNYLKFRKIVYNLPLNKTSKCELNVK